MKKRVLLIDDEFGTIQEFKSVFIKPLNHEYLERIVDDNHFFDERKEVYLNKLLHEIGIPSHLIGYTYIKAGISSISKNHDGSIKIKNLYHKISEKFSTNNSCVERAIRHAIDTTLLSKEKNELSQKLVEQVEQIQELIEVNSRVAQNQEEYQKQYEKLLNEYEITRAEHQKMELDISNKLAKSETLSVFINTIKKQETLLESFDETMWGSLLESVIVNKDDVLFKFRDGTEIKG